MSEDRAVHHVQLTWTGGQSLAIFSNGMVVRRTLDDTATAIYIDGVMHAVTEPFDTVLANFNGMFGRR